MITDRIGRHEVLSPINQNFDEIGEIARQQCAHMTRSVHLHRHDELTVPLTVLLQCPITSMMRIVSYYCSNRASVNQSRSRILL